MACDQCGHPGRGHNGGCPTLGGGGGSSGGRRKKKRGSQPVSNSKDFKKHKHDWSIDKIRTHRDPVTGNLIRYKTYKCLNDNCPDGGVREEEEFIRGS